jgi:conjugative transfer pilus assembly protein TraH
MFNAMGGVSNVTAPGAFRGQVMSTYTGGSFYYRSPQRNYQFLRIALPRIEAGCNGIDAFGGSFSHISGDQLRDLFRGIQSALPAVAFNLAIKSVSPLLAGVMENMQSIAQDINNFNRNSCQLATSMLNKAGDVMGISTRKTCGYLATWFTEAPDQAAGEAYCAANENAMDQRARSDPDPAVRSLVPFAGNLTWEALKNLSGIDDAGRELIMNIVGTVIYAPPADPAHAKPHHFDAKLTDPRVLVYGETATGGVSMWTCAGNYDTCIAPTLNTVSLTPVLDRVTTMMTQLVQSIRTRSALPDDSPIYGLINTSTLPVYRMLSLDTSVQRGTAESLITAYREPIALDYAISFLRQFVNNGLGSLSQTYDLNEFQRQDVKILRDRVRDFETKLRDEQKLLNVRVTSMSAVASSLEQLERNLRATMPAYMRQMVSRDGQLR